MEKKMRLDKFLTEMAAGTRSQVKDMAKRGRIRVNGEIVKKTDIKVDPVGDLVTLDGNRISYTAMEYYMLNKPQGVVSATEDKIHRTVVDLIMSTPAKGEGKRKDEEARPRRKDLFPVGRLDIDTEGLLLITNDGELAHSLLSPKRHVDKVYYAKVSGHLPEDAGQQFEEGITLLDGTPTMGAKLEILDKENQKETEVLLTIREGKFHQVKRMFEALGCKVVFLKRLSMGSLQLDESLKPGEYRPLSLEEVEGLRKGRG